MNTKTMEGLIGAGTNIDLVNTPMRVYKEAQRKGDLATMERAMGYAGEFAGKAEEYRTQADEGIREEAQENRKKAEPEREEAGESKNAIDNIVDTAEISEAGKILSENQTILPENTGYSEPAHPTAQNLN